MTAPRDPSDKAGKNAKKSLDKNELRKKRRIDLSKDELSALTLEIGTPELPYPMWGTVKVQHEGSSQLEQHLTPLAEENSDIALKAMTARPPEEAWGILAREMPTPSMLWLMKLMLQRLKPESKNRQLFLMGDPGMGKSFMGGTMARVMSTESPRIYDCGGKNMNSMLFEMVLDFGAGAALPKQIEARMKDGKLDHLSLLEMRKLTALKVTVDDENGEPQEKLLEFVTEDGKNNFKIDWDALSHGSKIRNENVEIVHEVLDKISRIEGFDKAGGNTLGMSSQFGPAITDFIEGNFSTWDEYNKSKEGGDDALQTFLQFVNGEKDECTIENPLKGKDGVSGPTHFTFRREDVKPFWGIMFTGNNAIDGSTTRELNKSVYSRLQPEDLPEVSEEDWQHRICQMMTGVPVSSWYKIFKEDADENPKAFADFLWMARTAGLKEAEVDAIPDIQRIWMQNWERVISASEKLGRFYHGWRDRLDEDKAFEYDLDDEIDPEYASKQSMDFRRVIKNLEDAMHVEAKQKPVGTRVKIPLKLDFNKAKERSGQMAQDNPADEFGTRLTENLVHSIFKSSGAIGKPKLYDSLITLARECSLVEIELQEGARSAARTVEDELNISEADSNDPKVQARVVQKIFCERLRQRFPEIQATDDQIITIDRMADIIADMQEKKAQAHETNDIYLPNQNKDELADKPLMKARLFDYLAVNDSEQEECYYDDVLTTEELLEAFVLPGIKDYNLNALWETNISLQMKKDDIENRIDSNRRTVLENEQTLKEMTDDLETLKAELKTLQDEDQDATMPSHKTREIEDKVANFGREMERLQKNNEGLAEDSKRKAELLKKIEKEGYAAFSAEEESADANDDSNPNPDVNEEDGNDNEADSLSVDASVLGEDAASNIAENRSETGLAFTTFCCRVENDDEPTNDDEPEALEFSPVHVLRSNQTDKTLVVANKVSLSLKDAFNKAKIKYVDLSDEDAADKVDNAVSEMVRGTNAEKILKSLKGAFNYRNPRSLEAQDAPSNDETLGSMMVARRKIMEQSVDENGEAEAVSLPIKYYVKPYHG